MAELGKSSFEDRMFEEDLTQLQQSILLNIL